MSMKVMRADSRVPNTATTNSLCFSLMHPGLVIWSYRICLARTFDFRSCTSIDPSYFSSLSIGSSYLSTCSALGGGVALGLALELCSTS